MRAHSRTVVAAGGVLWRPRKAGIRVGLIHRPRYDDWTLPKGKQDSGESLVNTAVREIHEETGAQVVLGRRLARIDYDLASRKDRGSTRKVVHYWAARYDGGKFMVNDEVDELRWVSPDKAVAMVSYPADRKVLAEFNRFPVDLHTLIVVRHAKAGRSARYRGDDRLRPLERTGVTQADKLSAQFHAFGVDYIHAADRTRCIQTVEPYARQREVPIMIERALSEQAYAADADAALAHIRDISRREGTHAICSQGKVIPPLLTRWSAEYGVPMPPTRNRKASMWVLSFDGDQLVALDHIDSPPT